MALNGFINRFGPNFARVLSWIPKCSFRGAVRVAESWVGTIATNEELAAEGEMHGVAARTLMRALLVQPSCETGLVFHRDPPGIKSVQVEQVR